MEMAHNAETNLSREKLSSTQIHYPAPQLIKAASPHVQIHNCQTRLKIAAVADIADAGTQ
jgi:hypothetical protein